MSEDVRLRLGRPARGWIIAPNYTLAMEMWRYVNLILKDVIVKVNKTDKRITLVGGHEIEFKSANKKDENLRGAGLDWAIFDEAARIARSAWEEGVQPALSDREGRAIFISTPRGRNWFWELHVKGKDEFNDQFMSWHLPTNSSPIFPKVEWENLRRSMPEMVFRQEFKAEFLEDSSVVFRNMVRCTAGDFEDPQQGHEYVLGVDLAKTYDFTVIWVLDLTTKHFVYYDRFQDLDWSLQKKKIFWKAKEYNNALVSIDSTGVGDPIEENLIKSGLRVQGFKFSNISKKELVELGVIALEQRWVTIPYVEQFNNEMMAFEYEILPSGKFRYRAPEGLHDDTVMAWLLALYPYKDRFYPRKKETDLDEKTEEALNELDDRSADFWARHHLNKKKENAARSNPLEGIC